MPGGLLERLVGRVTFVVGKGGVGKTTVSGGLALALADRGIHTHLLSTDPAHSLGDLFGRTLEDESEPSPCTDRLLLEELDAARLAQDRLRTMVPGLRELIDRGTYLDMEDAEALLDASLPGMDEIGGALRIAELSEPRLVVDTAPTGHMLRLLDTPEVVRSWLDVFDAMAGKADAVASALVGESVRLTIEREMEALSEEVGRYEEVVTGADFVVVTGAGAVEAAETRRLVAALEGRGLRVAATVAIDRGRPAADAVLPYRAGLSGCDGLREWWDSDRPTARGPGAAAPVAPRRSAEVVERSFPELDPGLAVFAGKGGVGKSTCAAATAVRLSESGPVLLLGADPAGSLHDIMDGAVVPGLEVREVDGGAELDRLRSLYRAEVERAFEAVGLDGAARLDRAVIDSLWQLAPPGVDELMGVSRLAEEVESGTRVVLDTAPTGHFLRLMAMPELALDWLRRIMRILLKYRAAGELDAPAGQLLRFARRFRALREHLTDRTRTTVVVVTLDEPLVRAETDRLMDRIEGLGLSPGGLVINRATGPVEPRPGVPTWRVPEVEEPKGLSALEQFTRAWERVS